MWSKELRAYTLEHFGDNGITFLKSCKENVYAVGVERNGIDENKFNDIIPSPYKDMQIILFNRKNMKFLTAYESVLDMVYDGWAID